MNETSSEWGEHKVNVVAFIAFAASGRDEFQSVFEQIVDVFADRTRMNEVVKNATTFSNFIDTLVHVIET